METAVFSGKGQRVERTLTAFAGSLIGGVLVAAIAVPWHYYGIKQERDQRDHAVAEVRKATDAQVKDLEAKVIDLQGQRDCEGLQVYVDSRYSSARKVMGLVNEFPAFKTEPFKDIHARLSEEANRQLSDVTSLQTALKAESENPRSKCVVAASGAKSPVLWNGSGVSLTAEGWMVNK